MVGGIYLGADSVYASLGNPHSAADTAHIVSNVACPIKHDAIQHGGFYVIPYLSTDELAFYDEFNGSAF